MSFENKKHKNIFVVLSLRETFLTSFVLLYSDKNAEKQLAVKADGTQEEVIRKALQLLFVTDTRMKSVKIFVQLCFNLQIQDNVLNTWSVQL